MPEDGTDEELIVGGRCWASLMFHVILRPRDQAETRRGQARSGSRANYRQAFLACVFQPLPRGFWPAVTHTGGPVFTAELDNSGIRGLENYQNTTDETPR